MSATTIERTGKRWKGLFLSGCATSVVGIAALWLVTANEGLLLPEAVAVLSIAASVLVFGGAITSIVARARAWWHHG